MATPGLGNAELNSVELFSGGGGLALAMHRAGFRHLLVNELERRACETLRMNRGGGDTGGGSGVGAGGGPGGGAGGAGGWPLVPGDVREVDFTPLAEQVDVVAGGVPCQPWSLGGTHRGPDDPRNLWPELFRCVRETRPRAVLAENVRGLLRPSFQPYYAYILRELALPFEQRVDGEDWRDHDRRLAKSLDRDRADPTERYDVFCLPVNAADYGVPQIRQRVFVVAFRRDLGLTGWTPPRPTHSEAALAAAQDDGSYWARHGLLDAPPFALRTYTQQPGGSSGSGGSGSGGSGSGGSAARSGIGSTSELAPWRTLRDAIADLPEPPEPFESRAEHPDWLHHYGWPGARIYRGHTPNELDRPAKTVKAGVHGVPGGETVLRRDDGSVRYLTVREVARIMTFPDDWWLAGPRGEQMRQLGNAVPVALGQAMATAVHTALTPAG